MYVIDLSVVLSLAVKWTALFCFGVTMACQLRLVCG